MSAPGSGPQAGGRRPVYGNYRAYYLKRNLGPRAAEQDPRLQSLFAFLADSSREQRPVVQRILDIGCNSGLVTRQLASLLEPTPSKVVGIDLDDELIRQAKNALRYAWSRRRPTAEWDERIEPPAAFFRGECEGTNKRRRASSPADPSWSTPAASENGDVVNPQVLADLRFFPACFPPLLGSLSFPVSEDASTRQKNRFDSDAPSPATTTSPCFPTNCQFVVADVMDAAPQQRKKWFSEDEQYDLIVCLSLTKWVHVHHGDAGLLNLLDQFSEVLAPHGLLLLEPHGARSYERTTELPTAVRRALLETPLEIKPEQLPDLLEQRGFRLISRTYPERPNHGAPGREVLLFAKRK